MGKMLAKVRPKNIDFQKNLYNFLMFPALKNRAFHQMLLQAKTEVLLLATGCKNFQQNPFVGTV